MSCLQPILQLIGTGIPCHLTVSTAKEDLHVDEEHSLVFRLEELSLDFTSASNPTELILKTDLSLQNLTLRNFDVILGRLSGSSIYYFRLNDLRKLNLNIGISMSLLHSFASAFPQLEDAHLNIRNEMHSDNQMGSQRGYLRFITFPALHTLVVRAISPFGVSDLHTIGALLDVIYLPVSKRLKFVVSFSLETPWLHLARNLVHRRSPLVELVMQGNVRRRG
ncbi:hypothetical protein EW145_g4499 [Phellinidium pouzarii]|uniref:Uncharacterized protein n=1 Tax=Phellinidium pouzarii TaxID=167371 RepID=A0A4S4L396_9AGAM|nr:hypothetical protein EW145_g4499 [Phellinidium pouzarii]